MYEEFYGLREKPFNITPDPKFLYLSGRHTEAFAHMAFGQQERGGFIVITGEVGTGKTTLARYFLSRLGPDTATAVVLYPALTAAELLGAILDDFHVKPRGGSLKDLVDALHGFLLEARSAGRGVVLLIDEAQDLSPEVLEQVRLLSNLETDTEKLIQIVLIGQSELKEMLARRELRQLAQRVTARYHLEPLSDEDIARYVSHRLEVAGGGGKVAFTSGALRVVRRASRGVPRLVNLICDRALLGGYVRGTRVIDSSLAQLAAREAMSAQEPRRPRGRWLVAAASLVAGAAALALLLPGASPAPTLAARAAPSAVPEPSPSPSPSGSPTPPAPNGTRVESLLASLARQQSQESASAQVRELWGGGTLERTTLYTHAAQLRSFDLPAVLEIAHPARREPCYLALLGLSGEDALVGIGGETLLVRWSQVDALWTRQATIAWRDFDSIGVPPAVKSPDRVRALLARLGYGAEGADLSEAMARFQRDNGLVSDGILGSRTLMALYARGDHPRPRLSGGRPS